MTIGWALLGPGRHAERSVVAQLKNAAGSALVAVMSRDPARGEAFARKHGIAKVYTTLDDVLRDGAIDALYDATPDGLHAGHVIRAAQAGKHSLVEKPLAISLEEGVEAVAAARRHGVTLGVVLNQRHEEVHREARRMVQHGEIGDVVLARVHIPLRPVASAMPSSAANWRTDRTMRSGGILMSIGDHAFDTLAYLVGEEIEEIAAMTDGARDGRRDERAAAMLLKLARGTIGYASASFRTPFGRRPFELHGTKGSLVIENSFAYLTGADADARPTLTITNEAGSIVRRFPQTECFRLEVEQFNRAIAGAGAPMTPPADALRALAVTAAAYAAVRDGRVARIADFLPPPD